MVGNLLFVLLVILERSDRIPCLPRFVRDTENVGASIARPFRFSVKPIKVGRRRMTTIFLASPIGGGLLSLQPLTRSPNSYNRRFMGLSAARMLYLNPLWPHVWCAKITSMRIIPAQTPKRARPKTTQKATKPTKTNRFFQTSHTTPNFAKK